MREVHQISSLLFGWVRKQETKILMGPTIFSVLCQISTCFRSPHLRDLDKKWLTWQSGSPPFSFLWNKQLLRRKKTRGSLFYSQKSSFPSLSGQTNRPKWNAFTLSMQLNNYLAINPYYHSHFMKIYFHDRQQLSGICSCTSKIGVTLGKQAWNSCVQQPDQQNSRFH